MRFEDTFYGRPNTIKTYRSLFRRHIEGPLRDLSPDWATWDDLKTNMMLGIWQDRKLSRRTQITLIRLLGRYVEFNRGPKVDTQRFVRSLERSEQQREVTVLNPDEAQKLMDITKRLEPRFYPVLLLALHAGLRRGEVFGLRCGDVDMLHGRIKVSRSYDGPTKNGRTRYVPMSAELSNTLTKARNLLLRNPSEPVFEQFDPNPVLRRVCAHAGVTTLRFHDLRHTFASLALGNEINPRKVADWLGHSSVVTTMSIYWNLTKKENDDMGFLPQTEYSAVPITEVNNETEHR